MTSVMNENRGNMAAMRAAALFCGLCGAMKGRRG
jgi:hypothetical protein